MYTPPLPSCSALLHIIVQHPKVVFVMGLAGIAGYVATSIGPGYHPGTSDMLRSAEVRIVRENPGISARLDEIKREFDALPQTALPNDPRVWHVVSAVEECTDIDTASINEDPELYRQVMFLYFLDSVRTHGLERAKTFMGHSPPR